MHSRLSACLTHAPEQALRVRDELLLALRLHPEGLSLDDMWPAVRRMVRARPGQFTPVVAGRLDKPDRTFQRILETAGYASVKAFLAEQPEVTLTVRGGGLPQELCSCLERWAHASHAANVSAAQGEAPRIVAGLTAEYLAAHPQAPVQPSSQSIQGDVTRVVVKRTRLRDLSAQLLDIDDWRSKAAEWARLRAQEREAAAALLKAHQEEQEALKRAAAAAELARKQLRSESAQPPPADSREGSAVAMRPVRASRIPLADKFPAWRRVKPPRPRPGVARAARSSRADE
jgi:hypothetical protein